MLFPTVHGENLEGHKLTLPADLLHAKNLLIIAFEREQQHDVHTWLPSIKLLLAEHDDFAYYELPTISTLNPLFRKWINTGMRAGIPDRAARTSTVTLYLDKTIFKQALALPSEDLIYLFLVDRVGEVLWRTEGTWSPEQESTLKTLLLQTV